MLNQNSQIPYTIQQVSELTGLSKQVIRKWEERYGIIQPKRLDNGYRVYSHEEVALLLKMKELTDKGKTIKQAISIMNQENDEPTIQQLIEGQEEPQQLQYANH